MLKISQAITLFSIKRLLLCLVDIIYRKTYHKFRCASKIPTKMHFLLFSQICLVFCDLAGYNRNWNNIDRHVKGRLSNLDVTDDYLIKQIYGFLNTRNFENFEENHRQKRVAASRKKSSNIISTQIHPTKKLKNEVQTIKIKETNHVRKAVTRQPKRKSVPLSRMQNLRIQKYLDRMKRSPK